MGSFDGAEVCELVGLFVLNDIISAKIGLSKSNVGIYRDDGLAVTDARDAQGKKWSKSCTRYFTGMN